MRIAVTGREGQIVRSLIELAPAEGHEILSIGRPEFDLAGQKRSIGQALADLAPDAIISAAAYTSVDGAESEPDLAFAVNEGGARAVAVAASDLGVPLVHLSTDYVFDGHKPAPYVETDAAKPVGVYGFSKLAGEGAVLAVHDNSAIVRTAWVYSPFGSNFVKSILRLAEDRDEIAVVADQHGNPTSAIDIADGILRVISNLASSDESRLRGIFHMTASGEATWADFAEAVLAASKRLGGPSASIKRISATEYPTRAVRPANSRLDCSKLARVHGVRLPDWPTSVADVVQRLVLSSTSTRGSQT